MYSRDSPCHSVPETGPAQQIMGPEDTYDILLSRLTVPKLSADRSNWMTYQEHIINALTSKKLCCHVIGTARKPVTIVKRDGSFYHDDKSLAPLLDKEIEEHEDALDDWLQKEAQI
ncbi:hypothetical protein C0993_001792 [Termitomyces sp. T159_Od127]|nr:hypothetical protein C0993_001792 [Termitomyces sp. T159_Od127]